MDVIVKGRDKHLLLLPPKIAGGTRISSPELVSEEAFLPLRVLVLGVTHLNGKLFQVVLPIQLRCYMYRRDCIPVHPTLNPSCLFYHGGGGAE